MQSITFLNSLTLYRPLLKLSKKNLVNWLTHLKISYVTDPTNYEETFLRGKMRSSLLPYLRKQFGKELCSPLTHLGEEATELKNYLEKTLMPYFNLSSKSWMGIHYDGTKKPLEDPFLLYHLIRKISEPFTFSRYALLHLRDWMLQGSSNKSLYKGNWQAYVDRFHFFIIPKSLPLFKNSFELKEGFYLCPPWNIEIQISEQSIYSPPTWQDVWKGEIQWEIPYEPKLQLALPVVNLGLKSKHNTLDRFWGEHRVPALFRSLVPIIKDQNKVVSECLTGKQHNKIHPVSKYWYLRLTPSNPKGYFS